MNACAMVARCFAHQHPEDVGRPEIPEPREVTMTLQNTVEPLYSGANAEGVVPEPPPPPIQPGNAG